MNRSDQLRQRHEQMRQKLSMPEATGTPPPASHRGAPGRPAGTAGKWPLFLLIALLLAGAGGGAYCVMSGLCPWRSSEWLIMVYMDGDNNLDPAAMADLAEMEQVASGAQVNVVVLADRAQGSEWSTARRFLMRSPAELKGLHAWDPAAPACKDVGEVNMGDPKTLRDFAKWAMRKYPAKKTLLVIWNHGGGWRDVIARAVTGRSKDARPAARPETGVLSRGIAWDDTSDGDFLETREVRQALEGLRKLSVIGCDACLMAMVEVAYEWRDLADYYVASQELEPGEGWPYDTVLTALAADPRIDPRGLSALIVDRYAERLKDQENVTLSAVDLRKLPEAVRALNDFAGGFYSFSVNATAMPLEVCDSPGFPRGEENDLPAFRDAGLLLKGLAGNDVVPAPVREQARRAQAALADAVFANRHRAPFEPSGLSVYMGGETIDPDYNAAIIQFARDTPWDEMLRSWRSDGSKARSKGVDTKKKASRWAALIGVENYQDARIPKLLYSCDDVDLVKKTLIENAGYSPDHILVLKDGDATASKVRSALGTELPKRVGENDLVVIYFSGHGGAEPAPSGKGDDGCEKYLMLADSKVDDMYGSAIPMSELARIFERVKADKLLFVLDSCYSGAAGSRGVLKSGLKAIGLSDSYLEGLTGTKGVVVLTACRANEVSLESPEIRHGLFTFHLCQGLSGKADTSKDGITTLTELYEHLSTDVAAEAKKLGAPQHPVLKGELSGTFPVGVNEKK